MIKTMVPKIKVKEAAEIASVSEQTIRRWIKSGKLKAVKSAGGRYRTSLDWISEVFCQAQDDSNIETGVQHDEDGYDAAAASLKLRFGLGPTEVPG